MRLVFDDFEIDMEGCRLLRGGIEVPLERRALDMLCYLAARPGQLVRKEELIAEVWRVRALSPGVLANTIAKLRRALDQAADDRAPIETVRGRGYRFHGPAGGAPAGMAVLAQAADAQRGPFVGRGRALELLDNALERVLRGEGQFVLLSGEAGIGKTRTLRELAVRARTRGFSVWEGAAYDGGGAPAFWPWIEVLRTCHHELSPASWQRFLPAGCGALARLVPELFPAAAPLSDGDAQALRFRLFDELTRFLGSTSTEAPRLIVLDDLHWADLATVELLAHAAPALSKRPILLAAGLRDRDAVLSEQHAAALGRLSRHARRVALRGLALPEISELVVTLHGSAAGEADCAQILAERTQGNPFFILQMLELLAQQGKPPDAVSLSSLEAPTAVRHVIRQRMASLAGPSRVALAAAAVIGNDFDAPLLAELVGASLPELLASLEPARRLGVVAPHASAPQRFAFTHALLRETLYDELGLHDSGALHARLAPALAARAGTSDARQLGEIARHYLLAVPSELDTCVRFCRRAADVARETSAFEAAAELLARALQKLESEGGDARTGCELALCLGIDQYCAGDLRSARQTLAAGAARARQLPDGGGLLARFVFRLFDCAETGVGDDAEVRALLDHALQAIGQTDTDLRAALLAHRAEIALELPFAERVALLDEADRLARQRGTAELMLEVAHSRVTLRDPTQLEHLRGAVAQLRSLLARHPAAATPTRLQMWSSFADLSAYLCALIEGDLAGADELAAQLASRGPASRLPMLRQLRELMAAGRALGDGRLHELEQRIATLRELSLPLAGALAFTWQYYLLLLADARGNLQSLRGLESPGIGEIAENSARMRLTTNLVRAWVLVKVGEHEQARAVLADVPRHTLARMPVLHGDLGMLCNLAEVYVELEDRAGAERVYAQLLPHANANAVGPGLEYHGSVEHYLGMLAGMLGNQTEARGRLARALLRNEELGMPLQTAHTRRLAEKARALPGP